MLTPQEKKKVKEILSDGLRIRPDINLPYYLDAIDATKKEVMEIKTQLNQLLSNQRVLDSKLDRIIRLISGK